MFYQAGANGFTCVHWIGKTKNNIKTANRLLLTAVCSVEPIVPDFRRMYFNVRFFLCLLENSLSILLTENLLRSHGF